MLLKLKPVKTQSDPSFLQLRFLHFMIGELICQSFLIYSSDVVYVSSNTSNQHLSLSSTFKTYHRHPCITLRYPEGINQFEAIHHPQPKLYPKLSRLC